MSTEFSWIGWESHPDEISRLSSMVFSADVEYGWTTNARWSLEIRVARANRILHLEFRSSSFGQIFTGLSHVFGDRVRVCPAFLLSLFCPDLSSMSVRKCPFVLDLSFCPEYFVPTFFGVSRSSATASLASGALYVFFLGTSGWWSSYTWVLAVVITMCMLPSSRDVVSCGGKKGTEFR